MTADRQPQQFFLELRFLHQPMRKPAQQIEMRAAALEAARPEPQLIGQQQRHATSLRAKE